MHATHHVYKALYHSIPPEVSLLDKVAETHLMIEPIMGRPRVNSSVLSDGLQTIRGNSLWCDYHKVCL